MKTQTGHNTRKHTSARHPATESESAAASETQNAASTAMTEACDRLSQKLDDVTAIIKEQIQAWQQIPEPAEANSAGNETAPDPGSSAAKGLPLNASISRTQESGNSDIDQIPEATSPESATAARQLIETISRSRDGWQEQAASLQQALESIMDFLEGQAAAAAATSKVDVNDILSRLRDLEEEQQNLRSQMSVNRWGPS